MEKLIGLILFLVIFVVSKMFENAQRTQAAQKQKQRQANDRAGYSRPEGKPAGQVRRPEASVPKNADYYAPKDEVEEFLRTIGVIKDESPVPVQEPPPRKQVKKEKKQVKPVQVTQPPVEVKQSFDTKPLDMPLKTTPDVEHESGFNISLLRTKDNLKNAFMLSEILKPPLALRKFRDR